MTEPTTRQLRDEAQRAWHKEREDLILLRDMMTHLHKLYLLQLQRVNDAHEGYRDAKELWRVGRDFNVTDIKNARLLQKLRDGGVR